MSRLTREQRAALLEDYQAGVLVKVIAQRYGVGLNYPSTLAKRRGVKRNKPPSARQERVKLIVAQIVDHVMRELGVS